MYPSWGRAVGVGVFCFCPWGTLCLGDEGGRWGGGSSNKYPGPGSPGRLEARLVIRVNIRGTWPLTLLMGHRKPCTNWYPLCHIPLQDLSHQPSQREPPPPPPHPFLPSKNREMSGISFLCFHYYTTQSDWLSVREFSHLVLSKGHYFNSMKSNHNVNQWSSPAWWDTFHPHLKFILWLTSTQMAPILSFTPPLFCTEHIIIPMVIKSGP